MAGKAETSMRILDIAEFLGVSKQRAHQLVEWPSFPESWTSTDAGRLWRRRNIEVWRSGTGGEQSLEDCPLELARNPVLGTPRSVSRRSPSASD